MKRFLIVLLFLILPFSFPTFVSAQCTVKALDSSSESLIEKIITLFFGWLTKTDYTIKTIDTKTKNKDMTEYGDINDPNFKEKQAFAGSRSQDANSQSCLKGNVIKQTILGTSGYSNTDLAQICLDNNCSVINIKDLANYFIQTNKKLYCNDKNKLIDIESSFIEKVNKIENFTDDTIPESKLICYQQIYDEFYITPKDNTDDNEENAKKMVQTVIPANNQNKSSGIKDTKAQVDKNLNPANKNWGGTNSLRPASW
jgi:hypothetical protein